MSNTATISCSIGTTDATAELGMEIWLDDKQVFNSEHITDTVNFEHIINDGNEGEHELRFVMKNKTEKHTVIDENNEILTDARLSISDIAFEGILPGQYLIAERTVYLHDFNGSQEKIGDKFFGEMGCNGIVSLKFTTPVYLWLLETT